jgi:hypothetical protein
MGGFNPRGSHEKNMPWGIGLKVNQSKTEIFLKEEEKNVCIFQPPYYFFMPHKPVTLSLDINRPQLRKTRLIYYYVTAN